MVRPGGSKRLKTTGKYDLFEEERVMPLQVLPIVILWNGGSSFLPTVMSDMESHQGFCMSFFSANSKQSLLWLQKIEIQNLEEDDQEDFLMLGSLLQSCTEKAKKYIERVPEAARAGLEGVTAGAQGGEGSWPLPPEEQSGVQVPQLPAPDVSLGPADQPQPSTSGAAPSKKSKTTRTRAFVCRVEGCQESVKKSWEMQQHLKQAHSIGPDKPECPDCGKKNWANWESLWRHIKQKHEKQYKYQCEEDPNCSYHVDSKAKFQLHLTAKHGKGNQPKCQFCNCKKNSMSSLARHQSSGMCPKLRVIKCNLCNKLYTSLSACKTHVVKEHEVEEEKVLDEISQTWECFLCNEEFPTLEENQVHMALHKKAKEVVASQLEESITLSSSESGNETDAATGESEEEDEDQPRKSTATGKSGKPGKQSKKRTPLSELEDEIEEEEQAAVDEESRAYLKRKREEEAEEKKSQQRAKRAARRALASSSAAAPIQVDSDSGPSRTGSRSGTPARKK